MTYRPSLSRRDLISTVLATGSQGEPLCECRIDAAAMDLPSDWPSRFGASLHNAHAAMLALEGGAIANADEKRMVGHYWLRNPSRAPTGAAQRAHDPNRTTLGIFQRNGAFAEFLTVPAQNLHRVPDSVSDDQAIFVEPLAAALQILEQVKLAPTDRVAVLGDGKLGLLCSQVLAQGSAAVVWAIGKHPRKLALLDGHKGVTTCLLGELPARAPTWFDVVVECTGSPAGLAQALSLLRPRGTLVLKSTYAPPALSGDPSRSQLAHTQLQQALTKVVIDEICVMGSRCGPFGAALRMLAEGRVSVDPMIHSRFRLADGVAAFRAAAEPGVLKVVLTP